MGRTMSELTRCGAIVRRIADEHEAGATTQTLQRPWGQSSRPPQVVLLEMSPLPLVLWHEQHPKGHERDFDHWLQIFGNYLPENSLVQMSQVCV